VSLWAKFQELGHVAQMFALYCAATALDFLSSLGIRPPHEETNPFARHADGSFWPAHAFINCGVNTVEYVGLAALLYVAAGPLGRGVRRFAAGLPFLYYALGHLDAAAGNLLGLWPHLYVETYNDILKRLTGQ
jgi:hypothetical protein